MLTLVALIALLVAAAPAVANGPRLDFLGQAIVPTGTTFQGTTVGGLSSITYDARHGVFYALSDDASVLQPTRFYTVGLDIRDGRLTDGDVHLEAVTTLLAPGGQPYAPSSLDPEGLALTRDRRLIFTSEGIQTAGVNPFVRRYSLRGEFLGDLPVPRPFEVTSDGSSGVRQNLGFESAGTSPDGRYVFTGTENALFQDGPAATIANRSPSRLMRYDLRNGRLDRQWVYDDEPVAEPPVPSTAFSVNGLVELLPLSDHFLISMERSFSVGGIATGTGNSIKLYKVALPGATDVNGVDSLAGKLDSVRPAEKTLLFDLDTLGIPLDNVEGLTLGPKLADGRQSVVLVSDNNFAASQFTQFLLFALGK
jgi:3-phytase/alkaline phosphatase D